MAYEFDDEEDTGEDEGYDAEGMLEEAGLSPLMALREQSTTADAKSAASKMLEELYKERESTRGEEQSTMRDYENQAAEARKVLADARARLSARQSDKKLMYLRRSAAWLQPTSSGHFSESAGNAANAEANFREQELKDQYGRENDMLALSQADQRIQNQLTAQRLKAIQSRRAQQDRLMNTALTTLGKATSGTGTRGATRMSKYGKQALDEGLVPDSPEFVGRVKQLYDADMHMRRVTSGTDVTGPNPAQNQQDVAYTLGVPTAVADPFAGLSTKDRQDSRQAAQKAASAQMDKMRPYLEENNAAVNMAKRFLVLNKKVNTSGLIGAARNMHLHVPYMGDVGQAVGNVVSSATGLSPEATEMDKLQVDLGRAKRMPGERFTNFDQQMLMSSVMGRDKPYQTNKNLANGMIAAKTLANDHIQFLNDYLQANHHLEGAEHFWDEYLKANPIYDPIKSKLPDKDGNTPAVVLNPNRVDYRTYFRSKKKAAPGAAQPQGYAEGGKVRQAAQGATFGFSDELSGDTEEARRQLERSANEDPLSTLAAQGTGAAATALAARAALRRAVGTKKGKGKVRNLAAALQAIADRNPIKSQMVTGATVGGLSTIGGSDEGMEGSVPGGMTVGAMTAPVVALATRKGRQVVRRMLPGAKPSTKAEQKIIEAMPPDAGAAMQADRRARVPTALADVPNPKMEQLTQDTLRHPGEETGRLGDALAARQAGSRGRVEEAVNRALKPDEYFQKEEDLIEALYNNSRPLYKQAYAEAPSVESAAFKRLEQLPEGQEAIKYAQKRMQLDLSKEGITKAALPGEQIAQARSQEELDRIAHSLGVFGYDAPNDIKMAYVQKRAALPAKAVKGANSEVANPSLEFLDYVKKGMDSQIDKAYRAGDNNLARLIRDHRDTLKDELDAASPTYKKARAQFAGDMEARNALRLGREELDTLTPQEFKRRLEGMSFSDRDALRSGVSQRLFEKINNPTADANYAARMVGSPAMMEKYGMVFDKPSEFEAFKNTLSREAQLYESTNKALQAARRGQGQLAPDSPHPGAFLRAMHNIFSRPGGMSDATANEVAKMLATSNPQEAAALLKSLDEKAAFLVKEKAADLAAGTAGAAAAGAMTIPSPRGYLDEEEELGALPDQQVPAEDESDIAPVYPGAAGEEQQFAGGGQVNEYDGGYDYAKMHPGNLERFKDLKVIPHLPTQEEEQPKSRKMLKYLKEAARSLAYQIPGLTDEEAEALARKPAYVVAGIAANLGYGVNEQGELVDLGEMAMGDDSELGIVETAKSLPTFVPSLLRLGAQGLEHVNEAKPGPDNWWLPDVPGMPWVRSKMAKGMNAAADWSDEHMPDWALAAPEKVARTRELVLEGMDLGEPETTADQIADLGGTMLGQFPLPGKKKAEAAEMLMTKGRSALDRLKHMVTAVPEYLGPTIRATPENYIAGTAGGAALQNVPALIEYLNGPESTESEKAAYADIARRFVETGHTMPPPERPAWMPEGMGFARGGAPGRRLRALQRRIGASGQVRMR